MSSRTNSNRLRIAANSLLILLLVVMFAGVMGIRAVIEAKTFRASVSGKITDTEGNPVAGVKVEYCLPNAPGDSVEYDMSCVTDSEGRYAMTLPVFPGALDTSADYHRHIRVQAGGCSVFSTYRKLRRGPNRDCDYTLAAGQ